MYEDLQREIMLGVLPPMATIVEMEIAERFACSQSTVREALIALNNDGLVERRSHRGTFVADARADDAHELIRIRRDIESRAMARVLRRFGALLRNELIEIIEAMKSAAQQGDVYQVTIHDRAFHLNLFDAADLPSVRPVLQRCLIHNHRFKILNSGSQRDLYETAVRHEAILDGLTSGDVKRATAAMSHHVTTIEEFGPDITEEEGS
ncbi:GntR family transcriptional regulator [uncultured Cohaesibacter sp.]|uniref:GntR family transcriptional regulator n=1 Tax=uncultured Cohaesibacter sp. TaxID=1002546 RepID=UPI0029C794EF|nr:GntR family transcriptional regulator [uncultured Cohaesibacter sp.]